jgi:two-component system, response regulator, stage 0 sporulation protein F
MASTELVCTGHGAWHFLCILLIRVNAQKVPHMRPASLPLSKPESDSERKGPGTLAVRGRLLVAEDDPAFRCLLVSALRADAHVVVEVSNGVDLIDALGGSLHPGRDAGCFDLVLSDVRMPGWTGLDALASLGHGPALPPVVFITAFGDEELHRRALRAGALAVFDKPIDLDDLRLFVREFLLRRFH